MAWLTELTGLAIAIAISFQGLQMSSVRGLVKDLIALLKTNSEINKELLNHLKKT